MMNFAKVLNKKNLEKISAQADELIERDFDSLTREQVKDYCKLGVIFKLLFKDLGI